MVSHIPKAELHCHVEGAASPDLVRKVGARHQVDLTGLFDAKGDFAWHDFTSFLNAYDRAAAVFRTPEDYRDLTFSYFSSLAAEGAIYGEVFISSDHALASGLSYRDYVEGLAQGIRDAEAATGIVGRMIATGVRHYGPDRILVAAETVANEPHPLVTGFGVAGDERMHHPRDFADAFRIAGEAGLGLTVHAGEFGGPQSVRDALDHLGVSRIGHGVRAIEDAGLVQRIVEEGIVLELCPGSNVALGLYPDVASHPFRRLGDAGVRVTVSSDDPPYFGSSIGAEYGWLSEDLGLSDAALIATTRTSLEAAFVDEATRTRLLASLPA
jgi:adenosine deaminase